MIPLKPSHVSVFGLAQRGRVVVARRPTVLMTVESAVANVTMGREGLLLDRACFILLPRGTRASLRAVGAASRVVVMELGATLFDRVVRAYKKLGVDRARLEAWVKTPSVLPRTTWVHEIVHRYVFERIALGENDNATTRFLETELLKEIYFLFRDRDAGAERAATSRRESAPVARALAYVEAHLLEEPSTAALVRAFGGSESTLLRAFRREMGTTPMAYWRQRKLDEALGLLRSGAHSVAEVALQVGYENATAFGFAFRRRFGRAPSTFLPRQASRRAP